MLGFGKWILTAAGTQDREEEKWKEKKLLQKRQKVQLGNTLGSVDKAFTQSEKACGVWFGV